MSDKKEKNNLSQRKRKNQKILDLLSYCRILAGNFHYIIFMKPAQKSSKKTFENYFVDKIYRPCDDIYELIYDSSEHRYVHKYDDVLKSYLVEHIILNELQSCGFCFKWKPNSKEYTFDGITFTRKVPWYCMYGGVDLDMEKIRHGLGLITHQTFFKCESRVLFCLVQEQDYQRLVELKSPLIQDFNSTFVIQQENLFHYAIDNK